MTGLLVTAGLISLGGYAGAAWLHLAGRSTAVYYLALGAGTAGMLAAWAVAPRIPRRVLVVAVLVGAALFRIVLVPTTPQLSDDLYRYLWDGRVQQAGINPYLHPPEDEALTGLRDRAVYPEINRRGVQTIYPGGAQLVFLAARLVGVASPWALKAVLVAADLLVVGLVLRLLRRAGHPPRSALLYAWNPLPILAFGQSGHIDVLAVAGVLLALAAWRRRRRWAVGAWLGAAAAVKLYPLLVAPALLRPREPGPGWWRRAWVVVVLAVAVLAASYLPYLPGAGSEVLGFLTTDGYLAEEGYVNTNRLIAAQGLGVPRWPFTLAVAGAVAAWAVRSPRAAPVRAAGLFGAALLLTVPYPWYAALLAALVAAAGPGLLGERAPAVGGVVWALFGIGLYVIYLSFYHGFGFELDPERYVLIAATTAALAGVAAVGARRRAGAGQPC